MVSAQVTPAAIQPFLVPAKHRGNVRHGPRRTPRSIATTTASTGDARSIINGSINRPSTGHQQAINRPSTGHQCHVQPSTSAITGLASAS